MPSVIFKPVSTHTAVMHVATTLLQLVVCCREPSLDELQLYEELCIKVEVSLMMLGRVYGALVLGLGLCDLHHMACGRLMCLFRLLAYFSKTNGCFLVPTYPRSFWTEGHPLNRLLCKNVCLLSVSSLLVVHLRCYV